MMKLTGGAVLVILGGCVLWRGNHQVRFKAVFLSVGMEMVIVGMLLLLDAIFYK